MELIETRNGTEKVRYHRQECEIESGTSQFEIKYEKYK